MSDDSEWKRKYDKSLADARAAGRGDDFTAGEHAALDASGCLPGWAGLAAMVITGGVLFVRRRRRTRRS